MDTQAKMKTEHEAKERENTRAIKRKPDAPKANKVNYQEENIRMGVENELELLMGEGQ